MISRTLWPILTTSPGFSEAPRVTLSLTTTVAAEDNTLMAPSPLPLIEMRA